MIKHSLLLSILLLFACERNQSFVVAAECFQLPAGTHLPRLTPSPDGLFMSYVSSPESGGDTLILARANYLKSNISIPLATGNDWFVNWADFPSVAYVEESYHGPMLFYHFLRYSAEGTYDYDVMYGISEGGSPFEKAKKLHQDTVAAEHGFLSSASLPGGGLQVTWLDGRFTKQDVGAAAGAEEVEGQSHGHSHGGGAMTLRTKALSDSVSVELDHRVCDCCNTATVATDSLIMVAYRDRSEHEIRDIGYATKTTSGGEWSTPKLVHADNWEISGCPVNGPALAANGAGNIAISWFTAPADRAQILFSRYDAITDKFGPPLILDDETPLGRVDLQLAEDGTAYVTGLTTKGGTDGAFLTLWTVSPTGEVEREDLTNASAARSSGFPKTALFAEKFYWTRTVPGKGKGRQFVEVCSR